MISKPGLSLHWRNETLSRMILGSAQLGMPYGIANRNGQPSQEAVTEIIRAAWDAGVNTLDTAQDYGESESHLGRALRQLGLSDSMQVITKLSPKLDPRQAGQVLDAIEMSKRRLGIPALFSVLLHRASLLREWDDGVGRHLMKAKNDGLTKYLGVSIYNLDEFDAAMEHPAIDVVQMPYNVFDQRAGRNGCVERAAKLDKLLLLRSIYLQGALLLPYETAVKKLPFASDAFHRWQQIREEFGMAADALAMGFVNQTSGDAALVMGAETVPQVLQNVSLIRESRNFNERELNHLFSLAQPDASRLINPSLW